MTEMIVRPEAGSERKSTIDACTPRASSRFAGRRAAKVPTLVMMELSTTVSPTGFIAPPNAGFVLGETPVAGRSLQKGPICVSFPENCNGKMQQRSAFVARQDRG